MTPPPSSSAPKVRAGTDADARAFWDQRYASVGDALLFGDAPSQFVVAHAGRLAPGAEILAVADGEGRNSVWLAARGHRLTATELSPVALGKAAAHAARAGVAVDFVEADVLGGWVWPQAAFDAVVAVFVQFAGPDRQPRFFADMKAAVRQGGLLLLHGYTPKQLDYKTGGPSAVENLYTEAQLGAAFADWDILELSAYERELAEGGGHAGRSALIDLVARRPR